MYTNDRVGLKSLEDQKPAALRRLEENCFSQGIRNLHQLNARQSRDPDYQTTCHYSLGAYFLLDLYEAWGEEALSAAMRELYLKLRDEGRPATEEEFQQVEEVIYQILLSNTPPGREDAFLEVYRQLHGGPYAD